MARRPEFRDVLGTYEAVLDAWAAWSPVRLAPLGWGAEQCRAAWARGLPLLADAPPAIEADELEDLLALIMERLVAVRDGTGAALRQFAEQWDDGRILPASLFPSRGRLGAESVAEACGLAPDVLSALASGALRPPFEHYFAPCRQHLDVEAWALGVCPFCGGPPGFSDVLESGQRRLACHLCGGGWTSPRTRCPFCGNEESRRLVRLEPEARDQGYVVHACLSCRGYLKELDRRVRWNGQSALVEDWGSPHFDLVATRHGYWRPVPTLLMLA